MGNRVTVIPKTGKRQSSVEDSNNASLRRSLLYAALLETRLPAPATRSAEQSSKAQPACHLDSALPRESGLRG